MFSPARFLAALAGLLVATGQATAGPIIDPVGDTFGVPSPGLDIVNSPGFTGGLGGYSLTVSFAGPISAPSLFAPNSVSAIIDLDLDRNPATGATPFTSANFPGPLDLGSEAYIDLFDDINTPGFVGLYDANTFAQIGLLPITFGANSFTLSLPASLIGNVSSFNYALVSIPLDGGGFDRAPNGATPLFVPEPATLTVVGLMLGGAFVARRRKSVAAA